MQETGSPLTREDVLVLLADGAQGPFPLDPVRLMKGAFLVTKRGRPEWKDLFDFEAYDYGPFDRDVYDARDTLVRKGLLTVAHRRYEEYRLSEAGVARANALKAAHDASAGWISRVGRFVTTRSFRQLIEQIYDEYPEYKIRSVYRS